MTDELYDLNGLAASVCAVLTEILEESGAAATPAPAVELAVSRRSQHGDLTTNAAMVCAKRAGRPPRELAQALGERWLAGPGAAICERVEVAGPGFLNLFLGDAWYRVRCGGCSRRAPTTDVDLFRGASVVLSMLSSSV